MFLEDELHAAYKLINSPILNFPFPHLYEENIFSDKFYSEIQKNLPDLNEMTSLAVLAPEMPGLSIYNDRMVIDFSKKKSIQKVTKSKREFWVSFHEQMAPNLLNIFQAKFKNFLDMRFKYLKNVSYYDQLQLVCDRKNYSLGPHTDQLSKVVSLLIYLPKDCAQISTGTSIYMPKDPSKLNLDSPHLHYKKEDFHKVITMPYAPNSAFCFIKTNNSFHGVEQIKMEDTNRWSLQYNIHISQENVEQEMEARDVYRKGVKPSSSQSE